MGVAGTQVPGLDALVTKPGLQTHVGTLLGPNEEASSPGPGRAQWLGRTHRRRSTLPCCAL